MTKETTLSIIKDINDYNQGDTHIKEPDVHLINLILKQRAKYKHSHTYFIKTIAQNISELYINNEVTDTETMMFLHALNRIVRYGM